MGLDLLPVNMPRCGGDPDDVGKSCLGGPAGTGGLVNSMSQINEDSYKLVIESII
jgi:hypothetical protein